jgi:hypothetical protein
MDTLFSRLGIDSSDVEPRLEAGTPLVSGHWCVVSKHGE